MNVNVEDIEKAAQFAMINLTEEEKQNFCVHIGRVLDLADKLKDFDLEGVEPTSHPIRMQNIFREDKVEPSYERDDILKNVPAKEGGYIKVPKVME